MDKGSPFNRLDPDKQERILDAAVDEFSEHGFAGASVNRLVKRLAIAKGSIFQYFGSKQGLFDYVFERSGDLFGERLREVRDETAGQDLFTRLRLSLVAGIAFIDDHPRIYRIYLKMLFDEKFPLRDRFLATARGLSAKYLGKLVDEAIARGDLAPGVDRDLAVFVLDSLMDRFLQAYAIEGMDAGRLIHGSGRAKAEELAAGLVETVRLGLGRKERP